MWQQQISSKPWTQPTPCEREVFLAQLSHSLAELYSRALDLPGVEPDTASIGEAPFSIQEWAALCDSLRSKIGPLDTYWKIFDSTANEPPVQGSLSSDNSEIYSDLKHDLRLENTGISHPDLLWELRFSFRSHWGKHLLGALAAIHDRRVE